MQKKNQLTNYQTEFQQPENDVILAGSDYANGYAGFINGAIESTMTVSRQVQEY